MKKLIFTSKFKILSVFILTVLIGLWSGGFFERDIVSFGISPNFSISEVEELKNKRVIDVCRKANEYGKVTGYFYGNYNTVYAQIDWEDKRAGLAVGIPKEHFSKCFEIVE